MHLRETISWIGAKIQSELFPYLEENFRDPITEKQKKLIMILEMVGNEKPAKTEKKEKERKAESPKRGR